MTRERLLAELRPHIADDRVLAAISAVPRERFVAASDAQRAWDNVALPIGSGQTISQPLVVARMCEILAVAPGERVLDVGTGSGYHAAVFAALGAHVTTVEIVPELAAAARARLAGIAGVECVVGDGRFGHPPNAPYDAISIAAQASEIPPAMLEQLADGGRLVAPVRRRRQERLVLVTRTPAGVERKELEQVRFVPLV